MPDSQAPPQTVLHLGLATMELYDGWSLTRFVDGREVCARHDDCGHLGQAAMAEDLGYPTGESMHRDHDVVHTLLPVWLGLRSSPTLTGLATNDPWPYAWADTSLTLSGSFEDGGTFSATAPITPKPCRP